MYTNQEDIGKGMNEVKAFEYVRSLKVSIDLEYVRD